MTLRDREAFLWDMLQAARTIETFIDGKTVLSRPGPGRALPDPRDAGPWRHGRGVAGLRPQAPRRPGQGIIHRLEARGRPLPRLGRGAGVVKFR